MVVVLKQNFKSKSEKFFDTVILPRMFLFVKRFSEILLDRTVNSINHCFCHFDAVHGKLKFKPFDFNVPKFFDELPFCNRNEVGLNHSAPVSNKHYVLSRLRVHFSQAGGLITAQTTHKGRYVCLYFGANSYRIKTRSLS